jgi:NodT family efflux transporter outer membrane factor (OMF) lipoprotein
MSTLRLIRSPIASMRNLQTFFLIFLFTLFSSCGFLPPIGERYEPPSKLPIKGWRTQKLNVLNNLKDSDKELEFNKSVESELANWWRSLGGASLEKLVKTVLKQNRDLEQAFSRVDEYQLQLGVERSSYFPSIEGIATFDRRKPSENGFQGRVISGPFSQYDLGAHLNWELDLFGATTRRVQAGIRQLEATEASAYGVQLSLIANTANSYFDISSLETRITVAKEQIAIQQETLDLVKARYTAGLTSELDLLRAKSQLAETKSKVPEIQIVLATSKRQLATLLGVDSNHLESLLKNSQRVWTKFKKKELSLPIGQPIDLLRRRPDLVEAERQLAVAFENKGAALADFFPRFSLTGVLGFQSFDRMQLLESNSKNWNIAPQINLPIFSGFNLLSNLRQSRVQLKQSLLKYEQAVIVCINEVEESLAQIKAISLQLSNLNIALKAEKKSLELSRDLYQQGVVDFFDVLNIQKNLATYEDSIVRLEAQLLQKIVYLYKALGGGWIRRREV